MLGSCGGGIGSGAESGLCSLDITPSWIAECGCIASERSAFTAAPLAQVETQTLASLQSAISNQSIIRHQSIISHQSILYNQQSASSNQSILIRHALPKMIFSHIRPAYIRRSDDVFPRWFFGRRRFFRRFGIDVAGGGELLFREILIRVLIQIMVERL